MGRTTYLPTMGIRQICAVLFLQGWHRFTAVLAKVCGHDTIHYQSFRGGITFGTNCYPSNGNTKGISSAAKQKKGQIAPIKGSSLPTGQDSKNIMLFIAVFSSSLQFQFLMDAKASSSETTGSDLIMEKS